MSLTTFENTTASLEATPNVAVVAAHLGIIVGCPVPQQCRTWGPSGEWNCIGACGPRPKQGVEAIGQIPAPVEPLGAVAAQAGLIDVR